VKTRIPDYLNFGKEGSEPESYILNSVSLNVFSRTTGTLGSKSFSDDHNNGARSSWFSTEYTTKVVSGNFQTTLKSDDEDADVNDGQFYIDL
jgi:hypothetical protein